MNESRHRIKIIMQGFSCAIVIIGLSLLCFATFKDFAEPTEKFKVVDKYRNCDVIRYTDPSNQWHYLLHCGL